MAVKRRANSGACGDGDCPDERAAAAARLIAEVGADCAICNQTDPNADSGADQHVANSLGSGPGGHTNDVGTREVVFAPVRTDREVLSRAGNYLAYFRRGARDDFDRSAWP